MQRSMKKPKVNTLPEGHLYQVKIYFESDSLRPCRGWRHYLQHDDLKKIKRLYRQVSADAKILLLRDIRYVWYPWKNDGEIIMKTDYCPYVVEKPPNQLTLFAEQAEDSGPRDL